MYLVISNPQSLVENGIGPLFNQAIKIIENLSEDHILNLYKANLLLDLTIPDIQSIVYEALYIIDPICHDIARICAVNNIDNCHDTYSNHTHQELLDLVESDVKIEVEDHLYGFTDMIADVLMNNGLSFSSSVNNTTLCQYEKFEEVEDEDIIINDGQNILLESMKVSIGMYSCIGNSVDTIDSITKEYSMEVSI